MTELLPAGDSMPAQNLTFIDFLLDETGSMSSCASATRAGFNKFVSDQRENGETCYLTLAKFDSASIRVPYENLDVHMVPSLEFYPNAATNLYDCIGKRLENVLSQDRRGKSLFIILTDGHDNASHLYTQDSARNIIIRAQNEGVVVVYMGPSDNAMTIGEQLGIPSGNIFPFETTNMETTMETLSSSTKAFTTGKATSDNFFA